MKSLPAIITLIFLALLSVSSQTEQTTESRYNRFQSKRKEIQHELQASKTIIDQKYKQLKELRILNSKLALTVQNINDFIDEITGFPARISKISEALKTGKGKTQNMEKQLLKAQQMLEATLKNAQEINQLASGQKVQAMTAEM